MLLVIVGEDGGSLCVVGLHSLSQDLGVIVLALDKRLASEVVLALNLGWVELDVVRSATCGVNAATLNSLNKNVIVDLELNSLVDLLATRAEHAVELLSLNSGSGEAVKQESSLALGVLGGIVNESNNNLVRNELTSVHN